MASEKYETTLNCHLGEVVIVQTMRFLLLAKILGLVLFLKTIISAKI